MNQNRLSTRIGIVLTLALAVRLGLVETSSQATETGSGSLARLAIAVAPHGNSASSRPSNISPKPAAAQPPNAARAENRVPATIGLGMPAFDDIMNEALKSRGIPGGALAIAKNGKLLVARGYGIANTLTREPVHLDTLFCTATITKTITAIAILHLVDQGKLSLEDPVYLLLGKPRPLARAALDAQIERITVRQLLLHAGGWNMKSHSDFLRQTQKIAKLTAQKLPLSPDTLLRYGLSQPLDFSPGGESHYSNFGYFLAKMIVERTARQPYETYVRQQILRPMGITEMRVEQLAPAYAAREAHRYTSAGRELPGGREPIAAPAGNWLASVVDMARFLTAVSGTRGKPFLSPAVYQEMVAFPPPPLGRRRSGSHIGLGWDIVTEEAHGVQYHKSGLIPGVRAYVEHRTDGIDLVLLLNSDGQAQDQPPAVADIIGTVHRAIDATHDWPDRNLFEAPATTPAQRQKSTGSLVR